jgi:putative oxidoreductase
MAFLFSSKFNNSALHSALLVFRVIFGFTMLIHGYDKLVGFDGASQSDFWAKEVNFLGLGGKVSLGLVIFAEFFCAILLIIGLATRFALIVLIICMGYAWLITHNASIFSHNNKGNIEGLESAFEYLLVYAALLLTGPGNYSADKLLLKK